MATPTLKNSVCTALILTASLFALFLRSPKIRKQASCITTQISVRVVGIVWWVVHSTFLNMLMTTNLVQFINVNCVTKKA